MHSTVRWTQNKWIWVKWGPECLAQMSLGPSLWMHSAKTWESECWYECKKTTTHSRGTWTVFCYSKQDNWVCSFQVTRMQTVFMHVYLCAWELVFINYSGSSWWSFRLILWLFDVWQLQHLNLIRCFVWVSLWTAAQLELHQSSEQSLVQPLRPPLYQI